MQATARRLSVVSATSTPRRRLIRDVRRLLSLTVNIDAAITELREAHCPPPRPYTLPSEDAVAAAERDLGVTFHPDYRAFLLRASDVCVGTLEPCILPPGAGHCDLFEVARDAWKAGVERQHLPICEDNGDYYCLTPSGEVRFWSHDGATNQCWPSLADWIHDVWIPTA